MSDLASEISPTDIAQPAASADGALGSDASQEIHRAERTRRLKLSILWSLLTKPLAIVIYIVVVPLFLSYLGKVRYGLYESIVALGMYLALMNLGLGMSLVNKLTDCHVSGDRALARRYMATLFWSLAAIAALGSIMVAAGAYLIDWAWVFPNTQASARSEIAPSVMLAGLGTMFGLVASVPVSVYTAYQELPRSSIWDAASKIASLLACIAVVYTPLGLAGVVLAALGVPIVVRLLNMLWMFIWEKSWLRPSPRLFDSSLLRGLVGGGICLFILQMASMALFQSDKLIIGIVLDPAAVPEYSVPGALFVTAYGVLYMLILTPLWPAHGEAFRRGDYTWVRRHVNICLVIGCGMMLACGTVTLLCGDWIIATWTRREDLHPSKWLIVGLTAMFTARAWVDCRSVVLNSAGVLLPQLWFWVIHAMLNLVAAVLMARHYGVAGVAWATFLTSMLTSVWGYPWMMQRYIYRRESNAQRGGEYAAQRP